MPSVEDDLKHVVCEYRGTVIGIDGYLVIPVSEPINGITFFSWRGNWKLINISTALVMVLQEKVAVCMCSESQ